MKGQEVVAHRNSLSESAFHHVPAGKSLQGSEQEQDEEPDCKCLADSPTDQEIEIGHDKNDADDPAQEAVDVFPPVNALEIT